MNRNVKVNRVGEDWTIKFLQFGIIQNPNLQPTLFTIQKFP